MSFLEKLGFRKKKEGDKGSQETFKQDATASSLREARDAPASSLREARDAPASSLREARDGAPSEEPVEDVMDIEKEEVPADDGFGDSSDGFGDTDEGEGKVAKGGDMDEGGFDDEFGGNDTFGDDDGFGDDDFSFGDSGEFPGPDLRGTSEALRMSGLTGFGAGPIDSIELANLTAWTRHHVDELCSKGVLAGTCLDIVSHTQRVRVAIDTSFLDSWTAMAWGVDRSIPIIVDLTDDSKIAQIGWKYLNTRDVPEIEIYQSAQTDFDVFEVKDKQGFSLRWFLEYRLRAALSKAWKTLYPDAGTPDYLPCKTSLLPPEVSRYLVKESDVSTLVEYGIPYRVAIRALTKAKGSSAALDAITAAPDTDPFLYPNLHPMQATTCSTADLEDFFAGGNPLERIAQYTAARFKTCTTYCVICDNPLEYEGVKPGICNDDLCSHSYETYGLGLDVYGEVKNNYEGADTFEPYPRTITAPLLDENGKEIEKRSFMKKDAPDTKHIEEVTRVGDLIPTIEVMRSAPDDAALRSMLDQIDPMCYPLIRWILSSNLAHVQPLPKEKHIAEMGTPHQFVLISANPAKEAIFRERRNRMLKKNGRGSFFAFHGSAIGNWHCIFRKGLKNYSKTKFMSTGAVHGTGIYLANRSSTSFGYMRTGPSWQNSGVGCDLSCIALCEVVDERKENPTSIKVATSDIFVVGDEDIVNTRFFFIYGQPVNRSKAPSASDLKIDSSLFE